VRAFARPIRLRRMLGTALASDLGYPPELLNRIPKEAAEAFTGVSSVSVQAPIGEGMVAMDVGCGAGLDSIVAAERVGRTGLIIGIDFSAGMLDRAGRSAHRSGFRQIAFLRASAEQLRSRHGYHPTCQIERGSKTAGRIVSSVGLV